jgi:Tol biopolymer transport system component
MANDRLACQNPTMLRGSLLAAALVTLLGFGSVAKQVRNGRIAYVHVGTGNRFQIYTMTAAGAHRRPVTTSHRYSSYEPAYSPNGKRIVFVRAFKQRDLWLIRANGTRRRDLTSTAHVSEVEPAWSPDGKEIAFAVESPAALPGIWTVGVDGTGSRQLTNGADSHPSWSADGSKIAFARAGAIYVVPASGGTPTQLTFPGADSDGQPYVDLEPTWSPDGGQILFVSDRGAPAESVNELDIWAMAADGSNVHRVTNTPNRDEHDPAWSPDARWIVYSGMGSFHGASSSQIYVSKADGSNRRILTHACGECAYVNDEPTWQPLVR